MDPSKTVTERSLGLSSATLKLMKANRNPEAERLQEMCSKIGLTFPPFIRDNFPVVVESRRRAAQETVRILQKEGFDCAVFGSMACKLYGNQRGPHDVNILVLLPPSRCGLSQADIKNAIVTASRGMFDLRAPSSDRNAAYRVLYYKPKNANEAESKIDIVLPGMMNLPALPQAQISWTSESPPIPLVPFDLLLFQKLQAWDDHRKAKDGKFKQRIPRDVEDLKWMLRVGVHKYMRGWKVVGHDEWSNRMVFSVRFERLSKERVAAFCAEFPDLAGNWRALGFEV